MLRAYKMNTEDFVFRCRKCRHYLFAPSNVVKTKDDEETRGGSTSSDETHWFLETETAPDWVQRSFQEGQFLRGKLSCPKCAGRIGAFDFISGPHDGHRSPAWILKSRVDFLKHILVSLRRKTALPNLPLHCDPAVPQSSSISSVGQRNHSKNDPPTSPVGGPDMFAHEEAPSYNERSCLGGNHLRNRSKRLNQTDEDSEDELRQGGHADNDEDMINVQAATGSRFEPLAQDNDTHKGEVAEMVEVKEGTSNSSTDIDIRAYTCPICLDIYYQPHTCRPCRHVFCAPCLRRLCGATPINTKCPLCREVIGACLPNHDLANVLKNMYPAHYHLRNNMEKKSKKLPPLPSSNRFNFSRNRFSLSHFPQDRNRNYVLVHWAGVCFVVLLTLMAVSVLATTIAMVVWYLWETLMDYFIDVLVIIDSYFDYCWQVIIMVLLEGNVSPELAKILAGSYGQVLHAVGKFFNRTMEATKESFPSIINPVPKGNVMDADVKSQGNAYTVTAFQVDLANYILFVAIITYLLYRFARYRQVRQEEEAIVR